MSECTQTSHINIQCCHSTTQPNRGVLPRQCPHPSRQGDSGHATNHRSRSSRKLVGIQLSGRSIIVDSEEDSRILNSLDPNCNFMPSVFLTRIIEVVDMDGFYMRRDCRTINNNHNLDEENDQTWQFLVRNRPPSQIRNGASSCARIIAMQGPVGVTGSHGAGAQTGIPVFRDNRLGRSHHRSGMHHLAARAFSGEEQTGRRTKRAAAKVEVLPWDLHRLHLPPP